MIRYFYNTIKDKAPWLMFLFTRFNYDEDKDIITQRRLKLTRVLNEPDYIKVLQIFALFLLYPLVTVIGTIFNHKMLTINSLLLIFAVVYWIKVSNVETDLPEHFDTRCGVVIDMKQDKNLDNYIWVRYPNKEVIKHNVGDQTYYDTKKNENICFEFKNQKGVEAEDKNSTYLMRAFICSLLWIVLGIITMENLD